MGTTVRANQLDTTTIATKSDLASKLDTTTAASTYAAKATSLAGYGITDAYTKTEVDNKVTAVYTPAGSVAFASLPTLAASVVGNVYNVTDSFTTTADFVEGMGKTYPAGTNVAVVEPESGVYKFDAFSGVVDLSAYRTSAAQDIIDATKADASSLATVATSGDYDDLLNKPTIPTQVTVDQTYDGSSTNPPSGAALETVLINKQEVSTAWNRGNLIGSQSVSISQIPQPVIDANTVALFHLDDSLDNSIEGSTATLSTFKFGTNPTFVGSKQNFGNCAKIADGYQESLISDHGISATSFTLDFWVKSTDSSSNSDIKLTNDVNLEVKFTPTSIIIDHYDGYDWVTDHSEAYTLGTMVHIAFTGSSGLYRVFINGVKCAEVPNVDSNLGSLLNLGNSGNAGLYFDEICISDIDRHNGVDFNPFTQPYSATAGAAQYEITAPTLATKAELAGKQNTLVSGTNIKTINSTSLLGTGDIAIDSLPSQTGNSGKFLTTDGTDASWASISAPSNVYTQDNLVAGTNIEIVKKVNPYVIDSNTFALFHYNTSTTADAGVGTTFDGFSGGTPTEAAGNLTLEGSGTWNAYTSVSITDTQKHFGQNTGRLDCSAGTYGYVSLSIPGKSNFNNYIASGAMTIDVWVKNDLDNNDVSVAFRLLNQNSSADRCVKFDKTSAKLVTGVGWDLTQTGTTLTAVSLSEAITFTDWNHFAFTYVLGENSGRCYGYVNGECVLSYVDADPMTTIATSDYYYNNPLVSVHSGGDSRYYHPYLSELRISMQDCYGGQDFDVPTQPYTTGEDTDDVYQINNTMTAPSAMTGATAGAAGTSGLVPAPAAGDQAKYLTGAGTWATINGLQNTATGTDSLTILGTATNSLYGVNIGPSSQVRNVRGVAIGYNAEAGGMDCVAIGSGATVSYGKDRGVAVGTSAQATADNAIAIGRATVASANNAIQLGANGSALTTNATAKSLQVFEWPLLDGTTGKIPADRLPSTAAASEHVAYGLSAVPQHVKLSVDSGKTVIGSGTTVYTPNGIVDTVNQFTTYTTTINFETQVHLYDNEGMFVVYADSYGCLCASGAETVTSDPTPSSTYKIFYNTTTNMCYFDDGTLIQCSLPLGRVSRNSTDGYYKVDAVFNGFGYIGSTIFVVPGVVGLAANGYNDDGTYKHNVNTYSTVVLFTPTSAANQTDADLVMRPNTIDYAALHGFIISETEPAGAAWQYWYKPTANKTYYVAAAGSGWTEVYAVPFAKWSCVNGVTTSFTPYSVFATPSSVSNSSAVAVMTGADGTNAGTSGLVPAPAATDNTKFLKGDGTWAAVSGGTTYTAGTGLNLSNGEFSLKAATSGEIGGVKISYNSTSKTLTISTN